jgi:hypothetical protein
MARTALTAQSLPLAAAGGAYFPALPLTGTCADLVFTAGDASNNNYVPIVSGKTVVLAFNKHATTTFTLSIISVADAQGRTGDITSYAIAAQTVSSFGPFTTTPAGWNQTSPAGLYLNPTSTNVNFAVLTLP